MRVLLTGASGFLASQLIPRLLQRGHSVYALARHPPPARENLTPIAGDVTMRGLGISLEEKVDCLYHLAASLDLGDTHNDEVWRVNVEGTRNALQWATEHKVCQFVLVSTAYTLGRNQYELSKEEAEQDAKTFAEVNGLAVRIFKPAILVAPEVGFPISGPFYEFLRIVATVHRRLELVRRRVEGALHLPAVEPVFRIRGKGSMPLNLVPTDWVAEKMLEAKEPGTYWLTSLDPPKLHQLARWAGEVLMVNFQFRQRFRANPVEALLGRLLAPFAPYLNTPTPMPTSFTDCPHLGKGFVQRTVRYMLEKK